jgi:hypothetical protein
MRRPPAESRALWVGLLRAAWPVIGVLIVLIVAGIFVLYHVTSFVYRR